MYLCYRSFFIFLIQLLVQYLYKYIALTTTILLMFHCHTTTVLGLIHQSPHYHCYPRAASLTAPSSLACSPPSPRYYPPAASPPVPSLSTPALHHHATILGSLHSYSYSYSTLAITVISVHHLGSPTATPSASSINLWRERGNENSAELKKKGLAIWE